MLEHYPSPCEHWWCKLGTPCSHYKRPDASKITHVEAVHQMIRFFRQITGKKFEWDVFFNAIGEIDCIFDKLFFYMSSCLNGFPRWIVNQWLYGTGLCLIVILGSSKYHSVHIFLYTPTQRQLVDTSLLDHLPNYPSINRGVNQIYQDDQSYPCYSNQNQLQTETQQLSYIASMLDQSKFSFYCLSPV